MPWNETKKHIADSNKLFSEFRDYHKVTLHKVFEPGHAFDYFVYTRGRGLLVETTQRTQEFEVCKIVREWSKLIWASHRNMRAIMIVGFAYGPPYYLDMYSPHCDVRANERQDQAHRNQPGNIIRWPREALCPINDATLLDQVMRSPVRCY